MFTFTTMLGTKPLTYGKFTKYLKCLLKQLCQWTGYIVTVLGEVGQILFQSGIPGEMIKLISSSVEIYIYIYITGMLCGGATVL